MDQPRFSHDFHVPISMDRSPRGFLGMTLRFRRRGPPMFPYFLSLPSSHPFISLRPFSHAIMTAADGVVGGVNSKDTFLPLLMAYALAHTHTW